MEPLGTQFNINYVEPIEEDDEGAGANDDIPPVSQLDFPPIWEIYEEDWESHPEPFDEHTPVRIVGNGSDIELYINYDAAPVKDFLNRYNLRKTGKQTVKESWKVGVAMYALSSYIEVDAEFDSERIDPDHVAEVSMRGIVQSMLDQQISDDELEALTV